MALDPAALVTVPEARAVLGFAESNMDPQVETVINRVTALAENVYCLRPLKQRTITALRVAGPGGCELYPEAWPIDPTANVEVIVDGVTQTLWKSEADGDPASKDVQVYRDYFSRPLGWASTSRLIRNVVLTYDGGYDPVPDDLKVAALELIQKMWGPLEQQRPDFASMSGPGGSIQTLDGQWSGQAGGAPWSLSRRSKEVFESYRRVRVF